MRCILATSAALLVLPAAAAAAPVRRLHVATGIRNGHRVYVLKGQRVLVEGARPFAGKGYATATVEWRGREFAKTRSHLRGRRGALRGVWLRFTARHTGTYKIEVQVFRAADPETPVESAKLGVHAVVPHVHLGSHGLSTRLLQRGLRALGYATPVNASYDDATARAVLAFRKVNGMERTESVNGRMLKLLFRGRGGFRLKYPHAGRHVEFDWSRQVLVLAERGRPVRIYHASSGKPSTPTVFGTFHFYLKTPGTNAKGMVDSNYFIRGYAVHGYADVPTYPASHGCIRVPIPNAAAIYAWIRLGDTIFVYP